MDLLPKYAGTAEKAFGYSDQYNEEVCTVLQYCIHELISENV